MATSNTKVPTKTTVSNFYKVLTLVQPSESFLTAQALRVDSGTATLGETLKSVYQSPSFGQSPADALARIFFLAYDRAPDASTFAVGMQLMRDGLTLSDISRFVLTLPGLPLSNDGLPSSLAFTLTLVTRALGAGNWLTLASNLATDLDAGSYSRGQLLAAVAGIQNLPGVPEANVETALMYLAGAGREASSIEMLHASATTAGRIIEALNVAGLSATGGYAALTLTNEALTLSSELTADLVWDLSKPSFKLGGSSTFKVFYSLDEGLSGSVASFSNSLVGAVTTLDAHEASGKGKITFTGSNKVANYFWAPAAGSTATGGLGQDTLIGGDGTDVFTATAGNDVLTGGLGDDKFILAASTVYQTGTSMTTITDFGNGKDTLDFSRLLNKTFDVSALAAILASSTAAVVAANGSVSLVANNGVWVDGVGTSLVARAATATDVAALFGAGMVFAAPTQAGKLVVITADTRNSADVWMVLNSTDVTHVTDGTTGPAEVFQVAHLVGSWNPTLTGMLPVVL